MICLSSGVFKVVVTSSKSEDFILEKDIKDIKDIKNVLESHYTRPYLIILTSRIEVNYQEVGPWMYDLLTEKTHVFTIHHLCIHLKDLKQQILKSSP